jgi:CelD/BcsL family acetyltransferase involved in cellulose biosynthesis
MPSLQVEEIDRIEQLAPLADAWDALLHRTTGASFFHTLAWLRAYWKHFGADQQLRVLAVSEGERVRGIVPMVVRRESTRVGRLRVLTYPLHDWGSFYGPLGAEPAETLASALKYLSQRKRDWDMIELRWVDAGSPMAAETEQALRAAGMHARRTIWDRTAVIDCTGSWESYLAERDGRWRSNLRRARRRLEAAGEVQYVRYRPSPAECARAGAAPEVDPRWDLYDACERIAATSWQGSSTTGTTLSHARVSRFLRDCHAAAIAHGMVDLNLLKLRDQPVAFAYNYVCGGRVFGLRLGYDPAFARDGVGSVLLARTIEDSFARGDRLYDLGTGYLHTKRHFMTRQVNVLRYSHIGPRAGRAQLIHLKRWVQEQLLQRRESRASHAGDKR